VTPPAEARGAGRLRRIRVEIEEEIRDEEKAAAAAVAIGMRGAAASALLCQREEWKWRRADRRSNASQGEAKIVVAERRTPNAEPQALRSVRRSDDGINMRSWWIFMDVTRVSRRDLTLASSFVVANSLLFPSTSTL